MTTLSERVQLILKEHPDLDQPELGRIAGVTKGTVNQWLDGKIKSMKLEYAARIQRRLGYSAIWLVLDEGDAKLSATADHDASQATRQGTQEIVRRISEMTHDPTNRSQKRPLSDEASELIQWAARLDGRSVGISKTFKLLTGLLLLAAARPETQDVRTAEELVKEAEATAMEILAEPTGTRSPDAAHPRKNR
ncbi:hypothetical protein WK62_05315 [Burkholderia ubonensis]|uniref:transcriptional regulator n=1 Tax=Burkholderia ubonensis TaxID=101571 RepID=UPI0007572008|nr:transcriptional regulator [Burkholderia ubonensis]KVU10684.1 hypothetical protein WK62_05315 [Burkholderia ubonensis]